MYELTVKTCEETCTCNACGAANYDSKYFPKDRKRVERLYEVHVGGITFRLCDDCADELMNKLKTRGAVEIKTVNDLEKILIFRDMSDFDTKCTMSADNFIRDVEEGYIIDDDGSGNLVIDDKIVTNAHLYPEELEIIIEDHVSVFSFTLKDIKEMFGDRVQIAWYNK